MKNPYGSKVLKWQGEKIKATPVIVAVRQNVEKPLCWYNYEVHKYITENSYATDRALLEGILIEYKDQKFCISNHLGVGINKLRKGGWPNHAHYSLPIENIVEDSYPISISTSFNLDDFLDHEAQRTKWMKDNFPIEYEKHRALIKSLKTFKK